MQKLESRIHHTKPFIVTTEVFSLFADYLMKPFFDFWIIYIVIVYPSLVAGIVGWVYVDTFYLALVFWEEGFECFEIISVNDHISGVGRCVRNLSIRKSISMRQYSIWYVMVVINDLVFANPF